MNTGFAGFVARSDAFSLLATSGSGLVIIEFLPPPPVGVPAPAGLAALAAGLLGLAAVRRRPRATA